jgi:flavin reductase (DIM6/NTAB) family NADH-FMN oxidoreductase RutF
MKKVAFVIAAASLFALAPIANRFGPVASSVALVWLGVLLAVCASGTAQSMAVGSGALGAFASGVLGPISPAVAGAVIVAAAFAERTTRIRSRTARAVHVLVALVGGGLGGALSSAFVSASIPVLGVAVVVAAVLAALPLLVEADDPVAHALDQAAKAVAEPARSALVQGAELRRTAEEVPLDRATQARVRKTWQSLLRLAEARVRLERSRPKTLVRIGDAQASAPLSLEAPLSTGMVAQPSASDAVLAMVDQRLTEHVTVLSKAYTAVDTVRAATLGLEDADLRTVDTMGDSLEDVSRAMVEVKGASAT